MICYPHTKWTRKNTFPMSRLDELTTLTVFIKVTTTLTTFSLSENNNNNQPVVTFSLSLPWLCRTAYGPVSQRQAKFQSLSKLLIAGLWYRIPGQFESTVTIKFERIIQSEAVQLRQCSGTYWQNIGMKLQ